MSSNTKTVLFLGASTGVGLAALRHTLATGHQCIALCRTPSKLTDILPAAANPNLRVVQGNAHNAAAVSSCLLTNKLEDAGGSSLVDIVVSTIGGKPIVSKMTIDDPNVCRRGMAALLEALAQLRRDGATGRPLIIACSGRGASRFGRDYPLSLYPLYEWALKVPMEDKKIMEDALTESGEDFAIVRPTVLVDGESDKTIRVGIEDPKKGRESKAIGYTISREDTGRWVAENLVLKCESKYFNKCIDVTY